jgi:hypothetical protein
VHGLNITCISVALSIEREVVIGIVYNPILDQMFTAIRGHGAYLNNKRIHTSKTEGKGQQLCALPISSLSVLKVCIYKCTLMCMCAYARYKMEIHQSYMSMRSQTSKEQFLEKNIIFSDVTLCGSCKNRRFGGA